MIHSNLRRKKSLYSPWLVGLRNPKFCDKLSDAITCDSALNRVRTLSLLRRIPKSTRAPVNIPPTLSDQAPNPVDRF